MIDAFRNSLEKLICPERMKNIATFDSVASTNDTLKAMIKKGAPDGQVVIADAQSAGKGRLGRTFISPQGSGIYFSMLFRLDCAPLDAAKITSWAAVAVCDAIEKTCCVKVMIRWVNDIVLNGKKICGILTEIPFANSECGCCVIVGIGVNVNNAPDLFPDELRKTASSLFAEAGSVYDRALLAAAIIKKLDMLAWDIRNDSGDYLERYRKKCITVGREVTVVKRNVNRNAAALSVEPDFSLKVRYDDGTTEKISFGEVSVQGKNGYV